MTIVARYNFSEQAAAAALLLTAGATDGSTFTAEHDAVTDTHVVVWREAEPAPAYEVEPHDITIDEYVAGLRANAVAYYAKNYPALTPPTFGYTRGPKFYRVFRTEPNHNSRAKAQHRYVHSFVERDTHHVYKASGWAGPAKGIRYTSMRAALESADKSGNTGFLYKVN